MSAATDALKPILQLTDDAVIDALLESEQGTRLRSAPRDRVRQALGETMMLAELLLDADLPDEPTSIVTVDPLLGNVDDGRWHTLLRQLAGYQSRTKVWSIQSACTSGTIDSGLRDYISYWDPVRIRRVPKGAALTQLTAPADVCVIYFWNYGASLELLQDAVARCKAVYIVDLVRAGHWICKRHLREWGATVQEVPLRHGLTVTTHRGVAGHRYALRLSACPADPTYDGSEEVRRANLILQNHLMGRTAHVEMDTLLPGSPCTIRGEPGFVLDHLRGVRQSDGAEFFLDGRPIDASNASAYRALAEEIAALRVTSASSADETAFWRVRDVLRSLVAHVEAHSEPDVLERLVAALGRRGIALPSPYLLPRLGESALFAAATGDLAAFARGDLPRVDTPRQIDRATPLLMAIRSGNAEIAQALIALRANPNAVDIHGWSALAYASVVDQPETRTALLAAGARTSFCIPNGMDMEELRLHASEAWSELNAGIDLPSRPELQDAPPVEPNPLEATHGIAAAPPLHPAPHVLARQPAQTELETVVACAVELSPKSGATPSLRIERAAKAVLQWLTADKKIPLGEETEFASAVATVSCEAAENLWALRYDDLHDHINGRLWRVEIVLTKVEDAAYGAVSVQRAGTRTPSENLSIPRVLKRLLEAVGLRDAGLELGPTAYPAKTPDAVDGLVRLISNPARRLPVVVIVEPSGAEPLIAPQVAAVRLAGIAHVVALSTAASFTFTRRVGRELGVFGVAVRIFRPGFSSDDSSHKHPLRVRRPDAQTTLQATDLVRLVVPMTRALALEDQVPSFALARALARRAARRSADPVDTGTDEATLRTLREEVRFLEDFVDEQTDEFARYRQSQELEEMFRLEEIQALEDQLRSFRAKNEALRAALASVAPLPEPEQINYPDSLIEFGDWVDEWMSANVVVLPRARRNVEKSDVEAPSLCYKALDLLCNYYVPMRQIHSAENRKRFEDRCVEWKFEVSVVGTAVDDRRFREHYRARHAGQEIKLDMHIKGPSARSRRHHFRVYFAYLEDQGVAIVGHMPDHLPNSLTD